MTFTTVAPTIQHPIAALMRIFPLFAIKKAFALTALAFSQPIKPSHLPLSPLRAQES